MTHVIDRIALQAFMGVFSCGRILFVGFDVEDCAWIERLVRANPCGRDRSVRLYEAPTLHSRHWVLRHGREVQLCFVDEVLSTQRRWWGWRPDLVVAVGWGSGEVGPVRWLHPDLGLEWFDGLSGLEQCGVLITGMRAP